MGTLAPAQNYAHVLNIIAGSDGMHDLQFNAAPHSAAVFERGALVSIDSNGLLVAGCADTAMPMWAVNSTTDFDSNSDVGNTAGGKINCFVATGGYEIFTTEYVSGSYAPNDLLTAATGEDAGKVEEAASTAYNDHIIVGCVSKGVTTSIYAQTVLNFWTMFIPKVSITLG